MPKTVIIDRNNPNNRKVWIGMAEMIHLLNKMKKHDETALQAIMQRFTPLVSAIIFNIAKGRLTTEDMEETVADVFITLWKNAEKIQEDKLKAYICTIAKSKAYDKLDTLKKAVIIDIEEADPEDDTCISETAEHHDLREKLMELIGGMNETDREIVMRYYFYYQKIAVIAERMGMNPETVKTRLFKARKTLKAQLHERGYAI